MNLKKGLLRSLCAALSLTLLLTLAPPVPARAADSSPKLIAFTFDDGPSSQTSRLLDALEKRGVPATFFMSGRNGNNGVSTYGNLIPRMIALGCEPANHTNSHAQLSKLSGQQIRSEVSAVESTLYRAAGTEYTELVRTPYGESSSTIRQNVNRPIILWSVDPEDWRYRNADTVYNRIVNGAHDGAIVLLHDLYGTSVDGGIRAIDTLRAQGYECVTVSELFRRRGIELQNGQVYTSAPNKGVTLPAYGAPTISAAPDPASGEMLVTLGAKESGLTLHYTTDGSAPTLASPVYAAPFPLGQDATVRAIGYDRFLTRTPVAEQAVSVRTAAPRVESWQDGVLALSCPTPGATIRYTTDGGDPLSAGTVYTEPFRPGAVTKAVASAGDGLESEILELVRTESGALFRDIPASAPYLPAVSDVVARGLMSGTGSYRFAPQSTTTRAELVTVLHRLAGKPEPAGAAAFTDVAADAWYAGPVGWAASREIVRGVTATRFDPAGKLTREQGTVLLYRYAGYAGLPIGVESGIEIAGASPYAAAALAWCAVNGIPCGGTPTEPMTRAECAAMLSAFCRLFVPDAAGTPGAEAPDASGAPDTASPAEPAAPAGTI